MEQLLQALPRPVGVISRAVSIDRPFLDFAAPYAALPGTVLLASGGPSDCARYHILAARPWLTITAKNGAVTLRTEKQTATFDLHPLAAVKQILSRFRQDDPRLPGPVAAGLFGYLAYDFKDSLETLPRTSVDDLGLPDMYLTAPRLILIHDRQTSETTAHIPCFSAIAHNTMPDDLLMPPPLAAETSGYTVGRPESDFTETGYREAVKKCIDYIAAGDVYQVNLSQRFSAAFSGDPYRLFLDLFAKNPAAFFAFIHAGDHHIVSTSPELFIRQRGRQLETRPIKGTRPRGRTPDEDRANSAALLSSSKDTAELSMIVDLLRNDLGRVCRGGSVRVTGHKQLEAYDNVFHLVSTVEGELRDDADGADIIAATFPGGSITGCPKIRAMEIIDELEPCRRHVYTGSIGYIGFHDSMDLSIAIRTAIIRGNRLYYSAGGGIVFDSDPADEYRETLAKAATVLNILDKGTDAKDDRPWRWINGRLSREETVPMAVSSPGFQYGAGLFETIRVDNGRPRLLAEHLERFTASWQALFSTPPPDITWPAVIDQVLKENRLTEGPAAIKIMAVLGAREQPPYDHTLVVTARPYVHRLIALEKDGLDLGVYPHPRLTATADHKTMNYLYYYLAGKWAAAAGKDEAIILNPDGTVSETNTASILLVSGRTVTVPLSPCVLPGVTQRAALNFLTGQGYDVRQAAVTPAECLEAGAVLLTNALMGAVPVSSIDGKKTGMPTGLCREINHHLGCE
ncbi:MAG: aminodeoxychorismate synthase component I [Thermodesulfobacteriota bacterium]